MSDVNARQWSTQSRVALGLALVWSALVGVLAWRSRGWPLIHDAPLMHYVAWRIQSGDVPYADIFDMNFPGTYLIHLGVLSLASASDLAWRLFDLGWLSATVAAIFLFARPLGRMGALTAGLLYAGYHLSGGPVQAGQRDFLLILPMMLATHLTAAYWARGALWQIALAGVFMGTAVTIKPTPAVYWALLGLSGSFPDVKRGAPVWRAPLIMLLAGLLPVALSMLWLGSLGGLPPFVEMLTQYVLPLYPKVGRVGLAGFISARHWGFVALLLALAVGGSLRSSPSAGGVTRLRLAWLGASYGFAHYAIQGKGWGYHLVILVAFLCVPACQGLDKLYQQRGWARSLVALGLCLVFVMVAAKGLRAGGVGPEVALRLAQVDALEQQVRSCAAGGRTVQVLDTAHGGVQALLRARVRQPTRFIYDFPLFQDPLDPYIQGLRAELTQGIIRGEPGCVILLEEGWPDGGYERFDGLVELMALLQTDYSLAEEGHGYRVFARR